MHASANAAAQVSAVILDRPGDKEHGQVKFETERRLRLSWQPSTIQSSRSPTKSFEFQVAGKSFKRALHQAGIVVDVTKQEYCGEQAST